MSSQNLSETKRKLLTTHERLASAYSMLCESLPSHTNEVDGWLVEGIHELQTELRELMAKTARLHDQI